MAQARRTRWQEPATALKAQDDRQVATLVRDLGQMIEAARGKVAVAANAALTTLYWQLGCRVRTDVLQSRRAEYGAQIVAAVARQLEPRHGRGFGEKNMRRMVQFAEAFPDPQIVAALLRQLGMDPLHAAHPPQRAA